MSAPLPSITIPRCTRCGGKLAYEGRPCHLCFSPATFTLAKSFARDIKGTQRAREAKLPRFAQPLAVRGKQAKLPRGERVVATLRVVGRWTWNSIAIAAGVHLIAVVLAMFLREDIEKLIIQINKAEIQESTAIAETPAPQPEETPAPFMDNTDDELVMPDRIDEAALDDVGKPEYEAPPDERIYAPEPQVAPPRPIPPGAFPARLPQNAQGLGGGQPEPVRRPPTGAGLFKNRQGSERAAAIKRYGGGDDTEEAVNLGLQYLARQQSTDGSWDPNKGFDTPPGWASRNNGYRGAITALCTLPFLAAGHSPDEGRYAANVRRAINWLMKRQDSSGYISYAASGDMYTHCVATLALCEAFGMTRDKEIGKSAERALRFLERSQGSKGGWDYSGYISSSGGMANERNDGSITGWAVLACKSAKSVGIKVNDRTWSQMSALYDTLSLANGETYYADANYGRLAGTRRGIGMVGVGLTSRVILGDEKFDKRNAAAEELLLKNLPEWEKFFEPTYDSVTPNFHTFYGLYYQTLGIFLRNGGEGLAWTKFNAAMKQTLLPNQKKSGTRRGSWPPVDTWIGPIMGDLYSTACSVLCLEVYYRYNPMHRPDSDVPVVDTEPDDAKDDTNNVPKAAPSGPAERSRALRALAHEKGQGATGELIKALKDEASSVRSTALNELAKLKAKDAAPTVAAMLSQPGNESLRFTIVDTLGRLGERSVHPQLTKLLIDPDESMQTAARSALKSLSGGKDYGTNQRAWTDWFTRNA